MKIFKNLSKIVAIMAVFLSINANALSEGKEYIVLKNPILDADNSLVEVFSYRCGHCYNHHEFNTLARVKQALPNLKYELFSASSMSEYGIYLNEIFAYALNEEKKLGIDAGDEKSLLHKVADVYFTSHFVQKLDLSDKDFFYKIGLKALGINKKQLDDFLSTAEAKKMLQRYEIANEIARNYGTPAFVVNGKYQINPEYITSLDELIRIVDELSKK